MTIPMDVPFMEVLESITNKRVKDLEPDEVAFLKARRYYLTPGQLDKFSDVLDGSPSLEIPKPRVEKKTKVKL
jgi:hypothetical protein